MNSINGLFFAGGVTDLIYDHKLHKKEDIKKDSIKK